jgi:hypothetical protein
MGGVGLCVGDHILQDFFTLYITYNMGPNSESTKLLDHPKTKSLGEEGGSDKERAVLFQLTFKTKKLCIAFCEPLSSYDVRK